MGLNKTVKLKKKMNIVQEKFNVDENSEYHETCQNFVKFLQSTRNDVFGRIFANQNLKTTRKVWVQKSHKFKVKRQRLNHCFFTLNL